MHDNRAEPPIPGFTLLYDLAACLRFFSRLPVPGLPGEPDPHGAPDFRNASRLLPLAGLIIAAPAALVLVLAWTAGLGPFVAAALALATTALVTGAMHEDGLADVADGFGGGHSRARILEIMRDSRIGAYGGSALVLGFALRLGALATLLDRTGTSAALGLLVAAALSRTAALVPMVLLPPARPDGASASVGVPSRASLAVAAGLSALIALLACALGLPLFGTVLMLLLAPAAAFGLTRLARARIGGQTGDVVGACQQMAEIAALIGLLAATPP